MTILHFDPQEGYFSFELKGLKTKLHAHPLHERIESIGKGFTLTDETTSETNLTTAEIKAGQKHAVSALDCTLRLELWSIDNTKSPHPLPAARFRDVLKRIRNTQDLSTINRAFLATTLHLSYSRAGAIFRQETGSSLTDYIQFIRLSRALNHFLDGSNLTEACLIADFYDGAHFNRAFQKYFGTTPSFAYNSQTVQVK